LASGGGEIGEHLLGEGQLCFGCVEREASGSDGMECCAYRFSSADCREPSFALRNDSEEGLKMRNVTGPSRRSQAMIRRRAEAVDERSR